MENFNIQSAQTPHQTVDRSLPRIWIKPHYASFNGLRGVAVFLVFLTHYGAYILPESLVSNMWYGVDLFFVLSGFLITGILFDSLHDPRFFRNFYTRRALRIFPIFYTFFLLLLVLKPVIHTSFPKGTWFYIFYLGNLTLPFADIVHHNPTIIHFLIFGRKPTVNIGHLWTLCTEEQFYLVWPTVVFLVRSRSRLMKVCILTSAVILLFRIALVLQATWLARHVGLLPWSTVTRADSLLIGAFVALWLRGQPLSLRQLHWLSTSLFFGSVGCLFLGLWLLSPESAQTFLSTVGFTLIAFASAGVLMCSLDEENLLSRLLRLRWLASFGAISYGFYFIHHLYMYEVEELVAKYSILARFSYLVPLVVFLVSLALAQLSFRFVESPFLKLKNKLAPQWTPALGPGRDEPLSVTLHVAEPQPEA